MLGRWNDGLFPETLETASDSKQNFNAFNCRKRDKPIKIVHFFAARLQSALVVG